MKIFWLKCKTWTLSFFNCKLYCDCSVKNNLDDVIDRLVRYVTVMPREDEGYDRCHRLPYISSEMLAIDSQIFYEVFFGDKDGK